MLKLPPTSIGLLALLAPAGLIAEVAAQVPHRLRDLGAPPGVSGSIAPGGVSADGAVASVTVYLSTGIPRAFRWTIEGGYSDMGLPAGVRSSADSVSADGRFVVGMLGDDAYRWSEAHGLEVLNAPSTGMHTPTAVSDDGGVVVGTTRPAGAIIEELFRWTPATGMQVLGAWNGDAVQSASVSGDGNVVYGFAIHWVSPVQIVPRSFQWTAAGGLVPFAGGAGPDIEVHGTNRDGSVAVGAIRGAVPEPFRWTAGGGIQILPTTVLGSGVASTISADGRVIAGYDLLTWTPVACAWVDGVGPLHFGTLPGDTNSNAVSLSADGSVALGSSRTGTGSSRAFRVLVSPLGASTCGPATPNSTGRAAELVVTGDERAPLGALTLRAESLPLQSFGYFLTSRAAGAPTQPPGSQGFLCLGVGIGRFVGPGQIQNSGASGTFALGVDLQSLPTPVGLVAGVTAETWHFQAWFRDVGPQATSNFTDAVAVVLR